MKNDNISPSVCILSGDPFSGHHGSYKQAYLQAKEIADNGIPVIMISPAIDATHSGIKVKKFTMKNFSFCRVSSKFFHNKLIAMISVTIFLVWIQKKYSILQIITNHYAYAGYLLSFIFKKKFIIVNTSSRGFLVKSDSLQKAKMHVIAKADIIVTKTSQLFDSYKSFFPSSPEIVKIGNGVDSVKFSPVTHEQKMSFRNELGYNKRDKIVLFAGNILEEKGVDILLDQFAKNSDDLKNIELLLVGNRDIDKKFAKMIEQQIREYNLSQHIFILGASKKIQTYYQIADVFVLPSRREGLPNVVLEAMATGVPCIVSNLGYTKDLITGDNGYLFDLEKPDKLWRMIKKLCENEELRRCIGVNARKDIEEKYSIVSIANRYIELYQTI